MKQLNIIYKGIDEVIPYENNPRQNDEAVKYVAKSIEEFGFKVPIIIDKDNVIVTGHTRLKAAKQLGLTEVPTILADDLTEEQIKAFRIADNKVSEYSTWDMERLSEELKGIDFDMTDFGFDDLSDIDYVLGDEPEEDNPYSQETHIPQYEPTGEFVSIDDLVNEDKTNELIEEIKNSNVSDEEKEFLIKGAQRHLVFDYSNIAEYYANASAEMQILMEKSALVIIDIKDAIANGYTEMMRDLMDMEQNDE